MYDTVTIEQADTAVFPSLPIDLTSVEWQTKTLNEPLLESYRVTADRRLLKEDTTFREVPEEDRPLYETEKDGFAHDWQKAFGAIEEVHHEWSDTEYHGEFEIHAYPEDERVSLQLKFTDGKLVDVTVN